MRFRMIYLKTFESNVQQDKIMRLCEEMDQIIKSLFDVESMTTGTYYSAADNKIQGRMDSFIIKKDAIMRATIKDRTINVEIRLDKIANKPKGLSLELGYEWWNYMLEKFEIFNKYLSRIDGIENRGDVLFIGKGVEKISFKDFKMFLATTRFDL